MSETEHLEVCRRRAAGRVAVDEVQISFDWLVPSRTGEPITFILDVRRGTRTSVNRFAVDLAKLAEADLQRLHDLLATRPQGYQLTYEIAWLLGLSLEHLSAEDRAARVRALLLFCQ